MEKLTIVGASLAGLSAARAARSQGFEGQLVIIGDEPHRPYDRPPLSKDFLLGQVTAEDLALESETDGLDAEWLLGVEAVSFDAATRTVRLADGRSVTSDGVVVATGARARQLPELADVENVHTLRTLDDAARLGPELVEGRRLLVVGAGFIGAEVASAAASRGLEVTVLDAKPVSFSAQLGDEMGAVVSALHGLRGVELISSATVDGFVTSRRRVTAVRLAGGRIIATDIVVVGIGAEPNTEWLAGSGIELQPGVVCDAMGRTSVPGVVAVGDCAAWFDETTGTHHLSGHWTGALERAGLAVEALLDAEAPSRPHKPHYFWSDFHGVKLQFAGRADGHDRVEIEAGDPAEHSFLAVYYRGESPIAVLGMNQPRLFAKRRRTIVPAALAGAAALS